MPCSRVISKVTIAAQFPTVVRDLRLIASDVAPELASIPPVAIFRKHGSRTQSDQQQNPSDHALHLLSSRSPGLADPRTLSPACKPGSSSRVAHHESVSSARRLRKDAFFTTSTNRRFTIASAVPDQEFEGELVSKAARPIARLGRRCSTIRVFLLADP
jgi:hypothetical protein